MVPGEQITGLLADLQTITNTARAGVISKRDEVLEPGETRPAAILFVDIVGFTPLARTLSSEVLTKVVDRTFRIFELTVRAHGGYCDKVIGDAALYVFAGHPNYPPVCEAALKAALKLRDRLVQVNASLYESGVELAIRQGVAFGEVTRQAVGAQQAQLTVLGDTVNQAQRLQATAQPDTIQTTARVLEKAGDAFTRDKLGMLELKGIGEVTAYRVTGVEEQPVRLRGAFRRLTPLVGREEILTGALKQVRDWLALEYPPGTWDITKMSAPPAGRNRLLLVRGVPAVGKSRFAYELLERIKAGAAIASATAHCTEAASLAAFTAELAAVAGLTADNLPQRWEDLCARAARAVSPDYAQRQRQHLRLLAYVLGCKSIDAGAIAQADAKSFAVSCQLAIRACCELAAHSVDTAAAEWPAAGASGTAGSTDAVPLKTPVILVIEDLQWMGGLQDVIADVVARVCLPAPLIVVGTARLEYQHAAGSLGEGEVRVIELDPLARDQGDGVIQALLPGLALPDAIVSELHEKAAGIPYFYEDFARMLVRKGLVAPVTGNAGSLSTPVEGEGQAARPAANSWRLTADIAALDIPEDIQALMLGRLDQLDTDLRELIRRASVLGYSFKRGLLATIERRLGHDHEGHPDDDLALLLAEKLLSHGEGDRYFYEHALLRQAAYVSLLSTNRRLLHGIAAEILGSLHVSGAPGELEILEQLVDHLEGSGQYSTAHQRACELLKTKAGRLSLGGWDGWLARAVKLWEQAAGTAPDQPSAYPPSPALHLALAELELRKGRFAETQVHADHVLGLVNTGGDRAVQASVLNILGNMHYHQGHMDEARACYEQSLAYRRETGDIRGQGGSLNNLGVLHLSHGRIDEARACFTQALENSRAVGDGVCEGASLYNLGLCYSDQGRMSEAQAYLEQSLANDRKLGDRRGEGVSLSTLGNLFHDEGRMVEALACLEQSLTISRELGNRLEEGDSLQLLGAVHLDQGRMAEAQACYEQSLSLRRELGDRRGEGNSLHDMGWLFAELGDVEQATSYQRAALAVGEALSSPYLRGICLAHLGRLYSWQGRLASAQTVLTEGTGLLAGLQDTYQLCLAHCSWVYYHLAAAGFIPLHMRQAKGVAGGTGCQAVQAENPSQVATAAGALSAAREARAKAADCLAQVEAGLDSELGHELAKVDAAIADFARAHSMDAGSTNQL